MVRIKNKNIYFLVIALLNALKVDDPVGCFGVHWASGLWSMICVGLFAKKTSPFDLVIEDGLFKGGSGKLLAYNIAGAMAISVWSGGLTAIVVCIFDVLVHFLVVFPVYLHVFFLKLHLLTVLHLKIHDWNSNVVRTRNVGLRSSRA